MIPDEVVEEVRERADIVEVIGEFVSLKRSGKDYKALCPFHEEKTPSFYVVPAKGFYKCFGCGESGDVFSFLMKRQGMEFVEAVKHAGRRSGVEVREVGAGGEGAEDPHRELYEANAFARRFYRERLDDDEEGAQARRYLEGRGIDAETVERYGLGYAPPEWRALRDAAAAHGIDDEVLLEAGLLSRSEKAPEPYDRFRDRIVFPIESVSDRVLGFGGRVLEDEPGVPKYLNSPESPIYHKGRVLYGLNRAKRAIRREEAALVVEGYMDAVALGAAGLEHVVAPLGTSMTEEQARILGRYCTRVYLLFDSDAAGLRATFRAADILLAAGLHPAVVTLPEGEDPDSVVQEEGADALTRHLDRAVDVLDRKLQILEERDYFSSIERTRQAVDRLLPTIRAAADPALRDIYVAKVADRTGVRRETLEEELARSREAARRGARPPERKRGRGGRGRGRDVGRAAASLSGMGPEREIVRILLRDPEGTFLDEASEKVSPEDFENARYRRVYEALLAGEDLSEVKEGMDPGLARSLEEIRGLPWDIEHPRRTLVECVNAVRRRELEREIDETRSALRRAEASGDDDEVDRLREELRQLVQDARDFGRSWKSTVHKALRVSATNQRGERGR